jgi:pimeloyl-ACP methyl ester carboxylesterase
VNTLHTAMQPSYRTVDGLRVRYAEAGSHHGRTILMFNPWPESLFAYEPIWRLLSIHARLIAVDLPGFGKSERRDELLSPQAMSEFIVRLIDELSLDSPHVVAPDVGTPASLLAAARHPEMLRSLVVGTGATAYPLRVAGALKELIDAPNLDGFRAADPRAIVAGAVEGIDGYDLPDDIREDYLSSYEGDRFVESIRYVRSYSTDLPVLGELLGSISTPVQIIAGRRDPVVPPVNAELLDEALAHSKLEILDAGHYVWEERAEEYAACITTWVAGGYMSTSS